MNINFSAKELEYLMIYIAVGEALSIPVANERDYTLFKGSVCQAFLKIREKKSRYDIEPINIDIGCKRHLETAFQAIYSMPTSNIQITQLLFNLSDVKAGMSSIINRINLIWSDKL